MTTVKMSGCMELVARMGDDDQAEMLSKLQDYMDKGVPVDQAQGLAAHDLLQDATHEREEFLEHARQQHADAFPMVRRDTGPQPQPGAPEDLAPKDIHPDQPQAVSWRTEGNQRLVRLSTQNGLIGLVVDPKTLDITNGPERMKGAYLSDVIGDHIAGLVDETENGFSRMDVPGNVGGDEGAAPQPERVGAPAQAGVAERGMQVHEEAAAFDAPPAEPVPPSEADGAADAPITEEGRQRAIAATFAPELEGKLALVKRAFQLMHAAWRDEPGARMSLHEATGQIGLRMKQAIFDQYISLKQLSDKAYMQARMSTSGSSSFEAQMVFGKVYMDGDVPAVKFDKSGGFMGVLARLGDGEYQRFFYWVAGLRAEKLAMEGKENLMSRETYKALQTLNEGKNSAGKDRAELYAQGLKELTEYNESVLKLGKDSGLLSQAMVDRMKHDPYVPFFRVMEETAGTPKWVSSLTGQEAYKMLKGGTGQLPSNMLGNVVANWSHVFTAAAKNRAAVAALHEMVEQKIATRLGEVGTKGSVWAMEDGRPIHYLVRDDAMAAAISSMHYAPGKIVKAFGVFKRALTQGVTYTPAFKVRGFLREMINMPAISEQLGFNVLRNVQDASKVLEVPRMFENLAKAAMGKVPTSYLPQNETFANMLASGAFQRMGNANDNTSGAHAAQVIRRINGTVTLNQSQGEHLLGLLRNVHYAYQEVGDAAEQMGRVQVIQAMERLKNPDGSPKYSRLEIAFASQDLMDFSLHGGSPVLRALIQTVPFLNARLQGLYKLARVAASGEKYQLLAPDEKRLLLSGGAAINKRFANVAGSIALLSLGLMLTQKDDPAWQARPDWDRDAYWWVKIGGYAFCVPKPFEVGAIGTIAERTWEAMFDDRMTMRRYEQRAAEMIFQTFALNPIPQAAKPLVDVYSNKNSFTGSPIESESMQGRLYADRYDANTSMLARGLGALGIPNPASILTGQLSDTDGRLSPVQIDYLMQAYLGGLGTMVSGLLDLGARPLTGQGARPSWDHEQTVKFLSGGMLDPTPSISSGYPDLFYERSQHVAQAVQTWRTALKMGDQEKASQILDENRSLIQQNASIQPAKQQLAQITLLKRRVAESKILSSDAKREQLDALTQRENDIARRVDEHLPAY